MRIPKTIKDLPFPAFTGIEQTQFMVTGQKHEGKGIALIILDFIPNPQRPVFYATPQTVRLVVDPAARDFGIFRPGNPRATRLPLREAVNIHVSSCYPEIDKATEALIRSFTGKKRTANHQLDNLDTWTREVIAERLSASRTAVGEIPDEAVNTCPDALPDGLVEWVTREVIANDNTLLYKKGGVRGTCALCGATVRRSGPKFAQGAYVKCPDCGEEVLCILSTGVSWKSDYVDNVLAIQRGTDDTVWFRCWHILRDPSAQYEKGIKQYLVEIARYAIRGKKIAMWQKETKEGSMFGRAYTYMLDDWIRSRRFYVYDGDYCFYPGGMDEAIAGTLLAHADLGSYLRAKERRRYLLQYAVNFVRYPVMEFLWKQGYHRIVSQRISGIGKECVNAILWQRGKLNECIRFPLRYLKLKPPGEWTMEDMHRMKLVCDLNGPTETERLTLFKSDINPDNFQAVSKYASVTRTLAYLEKQRQRSKEQHPPHISTLARTYRDYISECESLRLDLTQADVLFPRSLNAAHNRTMEMVRYEKNRAAIEQFMKQVDTLMKYAWENGGYIIRPAASSDELIAEGKALHHCVGGYAQRMANGETAIFVVRAAAEPDTPYCTLELKGKKVVQCRTKNNKPYEGEVKAFVAEWVKSVVSKGGVKRKRAKVKTAVVV